MLFLDPDSYATTHILDDFERLPHELLVPPQSSTAYVPIYGDGIHGRNPNPGHLLSVVDLETRRVKESGAVKINLSARPRYWRLARRVQRWTAECGAPRFA